jgi:nucleotidyltransferase substrate binding protein (TIGR01987 family)
MTLDSSALARALGQLEKSLAYCRSALAAQDPEIALQFRAAAIQASEFTYELSHKMLRRHLAAADPSPETVAALSFAELIREGYAKGLVLAEWKHWAEYRRLRTLTSHSYDAECAQEIFTAIPGFADEARHLLRMLETVDLVPLPPAGP